MSRATTRRRLRALAGLTAATAVAVSTATVGTSPATSAPPELPAEDCAQPFPVSEVQAGDVVDGLTVDAGTTPEPFTGEVLGVLEDALGPDSDLVMARLSSPAITAAGGIWQGMSGSPVYAEDGRLIGAVAYGLSWGPSPVAGITPFSDMQRHLEPDELPEEVRVDAGTARAIAGRGVTRQQAAGGFEELPMPLGVAGVSARTLARARAADAAYLPKNSYAVGRAGSATAAAPSTMVAGGNMAASASHGDITLAGVGTVTSVCQGRIVGFGHPFHLLGETSMGLHPAAAVYVQPESLGAPFKIANIGAVVGTITDDRRAGIAGAFGDVPPETLVQATAAYGDRTRSGSTSVFIREAAAAATFYQVYANNDRVLDGPSPGSMTAGWQVVARNAAGKTFDLALSDRYLGRWSAEESAFELADLVWMLSSFDGVEIESVTAESSFSDDVTFSKVRYVEQWRGGAWVRVDRKNPVRAVAGRTIRARVVLGGTAGLRELPLELAVPKKARRAYLVVAGGADSWSGIYGRSLSRVSKLLAEHLRNDEVSVQLGTPDQLRFGGGGDEEDFGRRAARREHGGYSFLVDQVHGPFDQVVRGSELVKVVIAPRR